VQATVYRFDPQTRAGSVLRDDGVELPFEGAALDGTGLRLLRPGQRVRLDVTGAGTALQVVRVQILTLP
jgi:cold shock CspA family protein